MHFEGEIARSPRVIFFTDVRGTLAHLAIAVESRVWVGGGDSEVSAKAKDPAGVQELKRAGGGGVVLGPVHAKRHNLGGEKAAPHEGHIVREPARVAAGVLDDKLAEAQVGDVGLLEDEAGDALTGVDSWWPIGEGDRVLQCKLWKMKKRDFMPVFTNYTNAIKWTITV